MRLICMKQRVTLSVQGRLPCDCTSKRRCLSKCMLSDSSRWQRESHDSHRWRGLLPFSSWHSGWWHTYRNRERNQTSDALSHSGSGSKKPCMPFLQLESLCRFWTFSSDSSQHHIQTQMPPYKDKHGQRTSFRPHTNAKTQRWMF